MLNHVQDEDQAEDHWNYHGDGKRTLPEDVKIHDYCIDCQPYQCEGCHRQFLYAQEDYKEPSVEDPFEYDLNTKKKRKLTIIHVPLQHPNKTNRVNCDLCACVETYTIPGTDRVVRCRNISRRADAWDHGFQGVHPEVIKKKTDKELERICNLVPKYDGESKDAWIQRTEAVLNRCTHHSGGATVCAATHQRPVGLDDACLELLDVHAKEDNGDAKSKQTDHDDDASASLYQSDESQPRPLKHKSSIDNKRLQEAIEAFPKYTVTTRFSLGCITNGHICHWKDPVTNKPCLVERKPGKRGCATHACHKHMCKGLRTDPDHLKCRNCYEQTVHDAQKEEARDHSKDEYWYLWSNSHLNAACESYIDPTRLLPQSAAAVGTVGAVTQETKKDDNEKEEEEQEDDKARRLPPLYQEREWRTDSIFDLHSGTCNWFVLLFTHSLYDNSTI